MASWQEVTAGWAVDGVGQGKGAETCVGAECTACRDHREGEEVRAVSLGRHLSEASVWDTGWGCLWKGAEAVFPGGGRVRASLQELTF